uniref:Uncharacterized protein n=1 Tax=viral metagenome TaxID=1070528 RepID=A0A6C0EZR8_9ZZZZ
MLKTIGLLSILPMLSLAFFIPFPVSFQEENKENHNTTVIESKYFQVNNTEEKICPFIEFVDKELCNTTTTTTKDFNTLNLELDPKDLCPLLHLVDISFCKSSKNFKMNTTKTTEKEYIDPKDLCPLLELIEIKLCS